MSLSVRARLARRLLPLAAPSASMTPAEQRARADRFAGRPGRRLVTEEVRLGGVHATQVRPAGPWLDQQVLHFHGGGFVIGSSRTFLTMVGELARRSDSVVTSVDYRLAPEHPWPAAVDDCVAAYRGLLEVAPADRIALVGESAGGNAVLATLVRARDEGLPLPRSAAVFSPWVDLTLSGESMTRNRGTELLLGEELLREWRDLYVGDADPADPGVSPLFADLSGLPPLHVQATTAEVLEDDARRLVTAARAAGVEVDLVTFDELWHVFQTQAPLLPEAKDAVERAAAFLRAHR